MKLDAGGCRLGTQPYNIYHILGRSCKLYCAIAAVAVGRLSIASAIGVTVFQFLRDRFMTQTREE